MKSMKTRWITTVSLLVFAFTSTTTIMAQGPYSKGNRGDENRNRREREIEEELNRNEAYRYDDRNYGFNNYGVTKRKPSAPRMHRPPAPSHRHVWVGEEWVWTRYGYQYRPGYWIPMRPNMRYVQGYWQRVHKGWTWVPGRWEKTRGRNW